MSHAQPTVVSGAVEGLLDEAVLMRLLRHVGTTAQAIYGKQGKSYLRQHVQGYNEAARLSPWVVLVDMNHERECAPLLMQDWLPRPAPHMCFRVVVREIEAWLLADRERLSSCLSVPASALPVRPEEEQDPKQTVVRLAGQSRRKAVRAEMTPRPGSGRTVGPAYTSRLIEFVSDPTRGWRPDVAAQHSDSLCRCVKSLRQLAARGGSSE